MTIRAVLLFLAITTVSSAGARELTLSTPWTSSLQISPVARYTQASVFGEGSVPAYRGMGYGVEMDYTIGTQELSMGPYASYVVTTLQNTANSSAQKEKLDETASSFGAKIYTSFTYLKLGMSQIKIKDQASGTVNNSKQYKSTGIEIGGGISYVFSDSVSAGLGLDFSYYKFDANSNNLTNRLDYLSYGVGFSLRFAIPSISPKER